MDSDKTISSRERYLQGLKVATAGNAQAFGFSILITVSYGIGSNTMPPPPISSP